MTKKISTKAARAQYNTLKDIIAECNAHHVLYGKDLLHPTLLAQAKAAVSLTDQELWNHD